MKGNDFNITRETFYTFSNNLESYLWYYRTYPHKKLRFCQHCFATYFYNYRAGEKIYFSFPIMPIWVLDLIEEFNNTFKNIKYEIIENKITFLEQETSSWHNGNFKIIEHETELWGYTPIISISFNEEYNKKSIKYLQYILSILLRTICPGEGFITEEEFFNKPSGKLLDFIILLNNRNKAYRSLSEAKIELEYLKFIDNVKQINKCFKYIRGSSRQTDILSFLRRAFDGDFSNCYKIKMKDIGYMRANCSRNNAVSFRRITNENGWNNYQLEINEQMFNSSRGKIFLEYEATEFISWFKSLTRSSYKIINPKEIEMELVREE